MFRAITGLLRAAGLHSFAHACDRILGPLVAGGTAASWAALIAAVALAAVGICANEHSRRLRRRLADELGLGRRCTTAGHSVVELPLERPLAISFDDGHPTTVISSALLDLLSADEVTAVVRHEAAHLHHHHQRLLAATGLVAPLLGRLPGIRRSFAALHLSVERWADEDACADWPAGRDALRTSLLRLTGLPTGLAGATQFADARTVAARVESLATVQRPVSASTHVLLYLPGTLAVLIAAPAVYQWFNRTEALLAMAGRCPV